MANEQAYRLAGVMGWPVAHSRSPLLHNHWIAEHGLRGAYVLLPVQPEKIEQALRALPVLGFAGCNLTIPHKVAAMAIVDHLEPLAQRIGAANTIVVGADGALTGRNTDAYGFIQSLRDAQPGWRADAGPACVVGAGGAARAVMAGLLDEGASEIRLSNRSDAKAMDMAQEFGPRVRAVPWAERHAALEGVALLVNTTNQGMHGQEALDLRLDVLPATALVSDIVYVPLETPLLVAAKARGNATVNGLGMLLNQARPAFEAWFGPLPAISPTLMEKVLASF
ncbi:MAG: shikimate dehydrogenase [Curvibacter sp. RIFCSPHIGHO2_12_FULL_63_18]|uniref:shikimate dehydrogenase n=1 Tax=Rhodoferax sp. TaxID=50421 RepID=UPI0008BD772E|nr:shikimate dehydrogenase [Rhodoferax sp.]OGO95025.1 MAG: shikimate dehydrogenase [Curvibacter sp. GWA2_63_95]OGP05215.1 MAG: shikimate dehydrogenase [Curvibacter sp. RIFCSPHIGHO2_12_FULL_63_18]HCX81502.1 shikimate dehydrogenase [Rhodoferax sp.]